MKYMEPKFEVVELELNDVIMTSGGGTVVDPDNPSLGDEERE